MTYVPPSGSRPADDPLHMPVSTPPDLCLGGWSMIGDALVVEALGRSGVDFVGLDVQHGFFGFAECVRAIQILDLLAVPSLIRISHTERHEIPRYLDAGADRVMLAMVEDPDQVRASIDLARYQPVGRRSYGGQRHGLRAEPDEVAEVRPRVYVMIETAGALETVDEIAALPDVAGVFVGPVDLSLAIGVRPTLTDPGFDAALARVVTAARRTGIAAGVFAPDGSAAAELAGVGFREIVVSSDIAQLRIAMATELSRVRASAG